MSPLRLSGTEVGYYRLKMSPWCMEWKAVELLKMRLLTRAGDWLSAVPGKTIYRELHCWSNETSRGGFWENWRLLATGWSSSCSHWRNSCERGARKENPSSLPPTDRALILFSLAKGNLKGLISIYAEHATGYKFAVERLWVDNWRAR